MSPVQLFALAEEALKQGDMRTAEAAYKALATNPDRQIRSEARFRLGMVYAGARRLTDAASLFRQILDEQPKAQRVRLELARTLDVMGDEAGARRALREAQAGDLPADVARFVDRYSAALRATKPVGASFEIALAPDSNINRATRSDTLGTVLGDFTLDSDAKQRSGVGLAIGGQAYGRARLSDETNLLVRLSGKGDLYRQDAFNDIGLSVAAGPELRFGRSRVSADASMTWRWFGGTPYSRTASAAVNFLHPLGRTAQLRASAAIGRISNLRNSLQGGISFSLSATYERALSNRAGGGMTISGERQDLKDPGYSTTSGQLTLFAYRDFGRMTLVGTLGYGRLRADERLFIYPDRRADDLYRASLGATFRQLMMGGFAPFARVTHERNRSNIELFDYRRSRTELGFTRAF
jgi:tetratricopeptide (TPR) repeat protein